MCKCWEQARYCQCNQPNEPEAPDVFGRVVLIVERGSVVSKPSYVDLIEVGPGTTWPPIIVSNGSF